MKTFFTLRHSAKISGVCMLLAILFAFAPTSSVSAQSNKFDASVPAGPFVAPAVAITRIEAHIAVIKPLKDFMTPGTQEYRDLEARIDFYLAMVEQLKVGKTVQEAITNASAVLGSDRHSTISKAKQAEYKQEAIDLLKL